MSNTQAQLPPSTTGPGVNDEWRDETAPGEWVLTKDEDECKHWWKAGSSRVNASFTRLRVSKGQSKWFVRVKEYNEYGLVEGSKTVYKSRGHSNRDEREWAHEKAAKYMRAHPAERVFTGKPGLPDRIGRWELVTDDHHEWEWVAGDHTLRVEETGYRSRYKATTWYFTVTYEPPRGDAVEVLTECVQLAAVECAVRCLEANPDADIGADAPGNTLQSVRGVGPAKALTFQLLGITTPAELRYALTNDDLHHAIEAEIEKHVTETIRDSL